MHDVHSTKSSTVKPSVRITAAQAVELPRFRFIALWLVVMTRKKENRGRLGLRVNHADDEYYIVSPVGGGTVVYATKDPALLFDYVRRTQLGILVRDAEEFRILAFEEQAKRRNQPSPSQASVDRDRLEREIRALAKE
jgi:hypothetical protein